MTRLFLRFYLGVIVILFVAWVIQAYVFQGTTDAENIKVIEVALGGGALLARDEVIEGGEANYEATIANIQSRFDYPVKVVRRQDRRLSPEMIRRLERGEAVLYRSQMEAAIPNTDWLVELGPLPQFAGPTRSNVLLGLGSVLLLAAGAIAIVMRPIARQFRTVERTALAIADGNFSARIDEGKSKRGLPIVTAFNTMAGRVETLLRSQKELLQAVSHELRTPLARIKFATELVRSADDETKRLQRLDSIDEATDRLDDLVGELLNYTRLEQGAEVAPREVVEVDELMSEAITIYAPLQPSIQFNMSESSAPIELITYRAGLLRAIGNLISNAGKYARQCVEVSVAERDGLVIITVDDDGSGIPEADRKTVFEPFKRLAGDTQPGAGLGLALVQRICQNLQGEVTIDTSPLGGARFQIKLPRHDNEIIIGSATH